MKLNRTLPITMILSLALATGASHATEKVYKWKDKRGVIHYSSQAPGDAEYEVVKKNRSSKPEEKKNKKMEKDLLDSAKNKATEEARKAKMAEQEKQMAKYCDSLKERLSTVQSGQLIKVNGEFMSGEARDKEIKDLNGKISADCAS